jgi:hypothetical protein
VGEIGMKQFNLDEYLAYPEQKIVTRDGRSVRIICTDRKVAQPIIAIVNEGCSDMLIVSYWKNGRHISNSNTDDLDLFFAPVVKYERWMNLYRTGTGRVKGGIVHDTEQECKRVADGDDYYLTTIKVEWEE